MSTKRSSSEATTLEQYRVALENATAQPEIASTLSELGFDEATIDEGKRLLAETRSAHNFIDVENDETREAFARYTDTKSRLEEAYSMHRKKAKVIFRKDPVVKAQLGLIGSIPQAYVKWMDKLDVFYSKALSDDSIINQLQALKLSKEDMEMALELMEQLRSERVNYLRERSEDQAATAAKDAAFSKIDDWMGEFFAVARIGLEDNPQLLEALGKTIRN